MMLIVWFQILYDINNRKEMLFKIDHVWKTYSMYMSVINGLGIRNLHTVGSGHLAYVIIT